MLIVGTAVVLLVALAATIRLGLPKARAGVTTTAFGVALLALALAAPPAQAAAVVSVPLGTTAGYSVLGASTVTNTGGSVLAGSVGLSPGSSVTGFPPGIVTPPAIIDTSSTADQAQSDLTDAYVDAAGRSVTATTTADLAGLTLIAGVYSGPNKSALELSGTLILDAEGDENAVFIFQTDSTLITASSSNIQLVNGAQACNVFWQVGSSATLGSGSVFVGNVLAQISITVNNGVTVHGRALARTGAVTLDNDVFTDASCADTGPTTTRETGPTITLDTAPPTTADTGSTTSTPQGSTTVVPGVTVPGSTNVPPTSPSGHSTTTLPTGFDTPTPPSGSTGTGTPGGPGTPGSTTQLAETGWSTAPALVLAALFLTIGLVGLLTGREQQTRR